MAVYYDTIKELVLSSVNSGSNQMIFKKRFIFLIVILYITSSCKAHMVKDVQYPKPPVTIFEVVYLDQPHFKVETATATYYIEKQSGGCSSMIDLQGRDWINFKKTGNDAPTLSSDSDYRGIPNLVFQDPENGGVGHPGFNKCNVSLNGDHTLLVESLDKAWQFRWIFHSTYVELVVDKTDDDRTYWFLYEGPVAGKFSPTSQYWGNDVDGIRTDTPSIFTNPVSGMWQWVFFGDNAIDETFFLAQASNDTIPDFFAYMGNSQDMANDSPNGMNVFGFGRSVKTAALLSGPQRFFMGFFPEKIIDKKSLEGLKQRVNKLVKE